MKMPNRLATFAAATALSLAAIAAATDISGAGATFPYPIYAKWADAYKTLTGVGLNYQSIGSGGGIAQIKASTVDFGSSDKPLDPKELAESDLIQFPSAIGGVVPVVNVEGVAPGKIQFTGPLLADIFLGKVTFGPGNRLIVLEQIGKEPRVAGDGAGYIEIGVVGSPPKRVA